MQPLQVGDMLYSKPLTAVVIVNFNYLICKTSYSSCICMDGRFYFYC
jgi:hypothetical protein